MYNNHLNKIGNMLPKAKPKRRHLLPEEKVQMIKERFNLSHGKGKRKGKKK